MPDYDVIIIGAGYGGVTAGALLAKAGKRVLLVDKGHNPGGKGQTVEHLGYKYEMWPVLSLPADDSLFHKLLEELDYQDDDFLYIPDGENAIELKYHNKNGEWKSYIGPAKQTEDPLALDKMGETFGVDDEQMVTVMNMMTAMFMLTEEELDEGDNLGMLPWMQSFGVPDSVIAYMGAIMGLVFVAPIDLIPISEGIRTFRQLFVGGGGRYHRGGYGRVAEICAQYIVDHGGEYIRSTRVNKVLVNDGRVSGISTSAGEFHAPIVISNAGIQPTILKLATDGNFDDGYTKKVESYEPGLGMVGVRYFLDEPVLNTGMIVAFSDESWWDTERYKDAQLGKFGEIPLVFASVVTEMDPEMAPDGHQIILFGFSGSPDPKAEMNEEIIRRGEEAIAKIWPEIPPHVIRKERYSAAQVSNLARDSVVPGTGGECIGLSQIIGQCGQSKPDPRTPLPGLYLVGTDAGGQGCGTHQAVDSGFNVAAMVLEDMEKNLTNA